MSTPLSPPSPALTPEELPIFVTMPAPALSHPAAETESTVRSAQSSSTSSSAVPSTGSGSQRGSSSSANANVASSTAERRAGGMFLHSNSATPSGSGTGTGIKTPRKNVQWAASTKGEGPMGAAAAERPPPPPSQYLRAGAGLTYRHHENAENVASAGAGAPGAPSEGEIRHMHLLDEEGLDPKAFQTLTHALERHQSSSRGNSPSSQPHTAIRRDFADQNNSNHMSVDHSNNKSGPSSRPDLRYRRAEAPRLNTLPPNPFSNTNPNANPFSTSSNFSEVFTPTTLSPIHSDAGSETEECTPELNMPGEVFIESTEQHGLPRPLPVSASNNSTEALKSSTSGSRLAGRFSRFPFRSSSKDDYATSSNAGAGGSGGGGKIGEGALRSFNALDAEEEEKRRVERRASKLVRAHTRGFKFLAGFKGTKALQHMAPEDIDSDAPLPRRPTRFSHSAAMERKRSRSAPASSSSPSEAIQNEKKGVESAEKSRDSSIDKDENEARSERRGLFSFRRLSHSRTPSESRQREDEDVENTAPLKQTHHAPLALGSGVLSALLTLYDRNAGGTRSGFTTPGDRTPSGSEPASPEGEAFPTYKKKEKEEKGDYFGKGAPPAQEGQKGQDRDEDERQRDEIQRINTRLNAGSMLDNEQERERFELERSRERNQERKIGLESGSKSSSSSAELTPPHPLYAQRSGTRSLQSLGIKSSFNDLTRTMSGGIEKIKEKTSASSALPISIPRIPILGGDSLPSGARSGAGVFGSLIASTGNLTGVAAPAASCIGPNPKKPGFHLNRYSWSEEGCTPEAEEALRRIKRTNKAGASGSRTPGHSPRGSMSGFSFGAESMSALGMSRSAPTTPAGEVPPSIIDVISGATPSPGSDDSPASQTPLVDPSRAMLNLGDSSPLPVYGHAQSKSLDSPGPSPLFGDRLTVSGHARAHSDTISLTTIPTRGSAATSTTLINNGSNGASTPGIAKRKWAGILKDFHHQKSSTNNGGGDVQTRSGAGTPDTMSETGSHDYWDEKHRRWVGPSTSAEEKRKRKRKKAEIFITRHVAEIMQRQEFILKLARAFMMFGAPSHRLPAQIQATARVLDMELSCMYLPDVMLISFDDAATGTSNIKFIRQGAALSLGKLQDAYNLYWKVIHDEVGVGEASRALDALMQQKPPYATWQLALFGGFCSAAICQVSFSGSFIDCLIAFPLGMFLVFVQIISVRNELYSNVFEITITTLLSFLSAVFAGTHRFCYSAIASGSIVLILPGFLVLNGSLELSSRNIVSGAVRLCYAIMYALFLGFGLSIGGTLYEKLTGNPVASPEDYTCANSHSANGPWYQQTPGVAWAFLTVPMFSLFLTLRNQAPWWKKELIVTVIIACVGWTCNHFSALKFPNRNDVTSAIGAFAVGFIANLYGRFFSGNAFVIMITGILFQLPSGLGNGGLITFASQNNTSGTSTSYLSGFKTALQLISVSVGLTVGLGISLVVIFPIQSRKRAGGIFSL